MRRSGAIAACVLVLCGCSLGGGGDESGDGIPASSLAALVLQPADLGTPWSRFDEGPQASSEVRGDPARFGRVGGWKARYRRPGDRETAGALVVESRADVFRDEEGAADDLGALLAATSGRGGRVEGLGDEAEARSFVEGEVRFVTVAWRTENAVGQVFANGFADGFDVDDAVELARKQAERVERASGG